MSRRPTGALHTASMRAPGSVLVTIGRPTVVRFRSHFRPHRGDRRGMVHNPRACCGRGGQGGPGVCLPGLPDFKRFKKSNYKREVRIRLCLRGDGGAPAAGGITWTRNEKPGRADTLRHASKRQLSEELRLKQVLDRSNTCVVIKRSSQARWHRLAPLRRRFQHFLTNRCCLVVRCVFVFEKRRWTRCPLH